jgi:hypothetical protein
VKGGGGGRKRTSNTNPSYLQTHGNKVGGTEKTTMSTKSNQSPAYQRIEMEVKIKEEKKRNTQYLLITFF